MTAREHFAAFRVLHEGPGAFIQPNAWDIGSARILANLGFKAVATTSAGYAASRGLPDGSVGREQMLLHAAEIVAAVDVPVSADLEDGFAATPEGVAETIRLAGEVGLAGATIEDTTGDPERPIIEFGEAVARIEAAAAAARSLGRDFMLCARAENLIRGRDDIEDTIARLQAFERAGADLLYAPGLSDLDTVRRVCGSLEKPVNVLVGLGPLRASLADLSAAGARRISLGSALARQAFGGLIEAGREMLEEGRFGFVDRAASGAEVARLVG